MLLKGNRHFANYNNECQNGYEYAATSLMMWHGMPYHSLAHVWYLHNNRYHGAKRNPWCEIEWGLHYSRSMASYGHFIAAGGFEYHGPLGYMAISPKITPENFKSAFTTAQGWGALEQKRAGKTQSASIELKYGLPNSKRLLSMFPWVGVLKRPKSCWEATRRSRARLRSNATELRLHSQIACNLTPDRYCRLR